MASSDQIKKLIGITLYLTVFQYSNAALVFADSIGASFILLSVHTNPGILPLREQYPRKIDAEGKAAANRILNASLSSNILKEKGIQATIELAKSPNSKVIVVGSGEDGLPIILGNN